MKANILSGFFDLVFPRKCELCGRPADRLGRHLCSACLMRLSVISPVGACRICGQPAPGSQQEFLCDDCRKHRPHFDRAAVAFNFEGSVRTLIHKYKFRHALQLKDDFADWMEAVARLRFDLAAVDAVLPMPLKWSRRLNRGYNQCEYLAQEMARRIDRRYDAGALRRCGSPSQQAALTEDERRENVKGTFAVRAPERVKGRTLLLIDDIMTTGATLSEAAKTLKEAGAERVWCVTLARTAIGF